ncbi:carbamoyltransferase HypF [Robertkochia marina]|uniref:Carbamoyltransferase n=1 Tax=Robertkochia marina TaxID=1227945 RepID=A0A4S3LXL0_9FLAO|nr:carbamoyltransferase HypF [Robertkochia marina]THD66289.1 carbamoyltransferase HypF [Robertkochia marina]TRZ41210.1 carbamoyltransferase HypF [Robertkochia marina]
MKVTRKITICGLVQGIGFRPFVHQVADRFHLKGEVCNNEKGVQILVTGDQAVIDDFYNELLHYPYELARIRSFKIEPHPLQKFTVFQIVPSPEGKTLNLPFTPDMAICKKCSEELEDPSNKRFSYPFTACVECGQRWAIAADYPFERAHTSYRDHPMCDSCQHEYTTLKDRRYHAQTISCPECGFYCWLEADKQPLAVTGEEVFKEAAEKLQQGQILAVKNSSGFLLCCDASNETSVNQLRTRKHRPSKPFAVLFPDMEQVKEVVHCAEKAAQELKGRVSPIVILPMRKKPERQLAFTALAPNLEHLGVMIPYNGILKLLAAAFGAPLVATSGNLHAMPVIADNQEALSKLAEVADVFLLHNQYIINPQDDTVVKFTPKHHRQIVFRRSRGLAPNYFDAPYTTEKKWVAMGGELKSAIAMIPNSYLYISQYLGALGSLETYTRYHAVLQRLQSMFRFTPDIVLADKHPAYQSRAEGKKLAGKSGAEFQLIQHHKAHFAAVLAENNLFDQPHDVLGVVWDGTGYGDDGQVWGGEFFRYEDHRISRLSHLEYFPWIAGDKMAVEPRVALLAMTDDPEVLKYLSEEFSREEWTVYQKLKEKNTLRSSSMGRVFDAVAALLKICHHNSFEGQAAMQLEALAEKADPEEAVAWNDLVADGDLNPAALISRVFNELQQGYSPEVLAMSFLKTLGRFIFKVAENYHFNHLAFSGGVFQNAILTDLVIDEAGNNYKLYFHKELSPNDENTCFGQLMYALNCKQEEDEVSG